MAQNSFDGMQQSYDGMLKELIRSVDEKVRALRLGYEADNQALK
jgi:hypothetical protein